MIRTMTQIWWLLALGGVLDAVHAVLNLLMLDPDGSFGLRQFALLNSVRDMSVLALAAGACAIVAGCWIVGKDESWLLSLHGLALGVFGAIGLSPLVRSPMSFRPISLLFVVMAVSLGAFVVRSTLTHRGAERGLPIMAGAASVGFAFSFVVVGFNWVKLEPHWFWVWMSSYFGYCAILMLWLALQLRTQGLSQFGQRDVDPAENPFGTAATDGHTLFSIDRE